MVKIDKPTYDLNKIKEVFDSVNKLVMTSSAKQGQVSLGFSDEDVYKAKFNGIDLYIKFQVNLKKELILSFKEK